MHVLQSQYVLRCSSRACLDLQFKTLQVWHVGSATADVLIAISMCYYVSLDLLFSQIWARMITLPVTAVETGHWVQEDTHRHHKTYSAYD